MPLSKNALSVQGLVSLMALAQVLATGCAEEPNPEAGVLVIPFMLGNHKQCEDFGIESVVVQLDDGVVEEAVACSAGQIRINNLMPGTYEVKLLGLDAEGYAAMDSVEAGDRRVNVDGNGATVAMDPGIVLSAAPAALQLRWEFGFGNCESAAVDHFTVTAWRVDGSQLLMEADIPCGMPGEGRDQYRLVPDEDRELGGDELGEVSVQAFDFNGFAVGQPALFGFPTPGSGREVNLSLVCDDGGCAGTGEPD